MLGRGHRQWDGYPSRGHYVPWQIVTIEDCEGDDAETDCQHTF